MKIYFVWACVIAFPFWDAALASVFVTAGMYLRMILEEKFLLATYPDYDAYSKKTKRILLYIF
ncbi:MAG: hypothetical protein JXR51_00380 [Bacteroidales bacterium]|nr:hypothetical protein [Bacteroidales bacterium]MBN2755596.1 hypothetical protein [Bacteroidales bacterium]